MDDQTFTRSTAERAGLPEETAEPIERATLRTLHRRRAPRPRPGGRRAPPAAGQPLSDHISGGKAQDLPAQLPARLEDVPRSPRHESEEFGLDEFVRRVAERGDVGPDEAAGAAAVLIAVRDAVTPGEFDDVLSQLPPEYRELVGPMS
jgi:uncharacterized protein (DUF2267 family)